METVEYKNISFTVWDVGGQDKVCKTNCVLLLVVFSGNTLFSVADSPSVEALLPEHPGSDLCGG